MPRMQMPPQPLMQRQTMGTPAMTPAMDGWSGCGRQQLRGLDSGLEQPFGLAAGGTWQEPPYGQEYNWDGNNPNQTDDPLHLHQQAMELENENLDG